MLVFLLGEQQMEEVCTFLPTFHNTGDRNKAWEIGKIRYKFLYSALCRIVECYCSNLVPSQAKV